jgi:hypothetical protein
MGKDSPEGGVEEGEGSPVECGDVVGAGQNGHTLIGRHHHLHPHNSSCHRLIRVALRGESRLCAMRKGSRSRFPTSTQLHD